MAARLAHAPRRGYDERTEMTGELLGEIVLRLAVALALGGALGLERSYHGRPAGFRTHALVGLASGALMLVSVYEAVWFRTPDGMRGAIDPTRMAQGIMTGIGFLGAGVIMREGLTVRGLTTAACIWTTAGIGILVGIGFYLPAALTTALALGALSGFRWIESHIRTESYAHLTVGFAADRAPPQADVVALAVQHHFSVSGVSHRYRRADALMEYGMTVHSLDREAFARLSDTLRAREDVVEFRISPTGD
jgi:putative Mg2+ transporter-C (MgtC) family protein